MGAKDWLIEKTAVAMLNQSLLKPYGTLKALKLDSKQRTIDAELELIGESQSVRIQVSGYELIEEAEATYLVLKGITTSREWLTTLARDFAVDRRLKVPEAARSYLPMLI
ncbi:MAG TPA: hypothetical protein VNT99_01855 [Methylomirabilota bacterium]|nr:hypothetical protein [Methylomirabilota bacterium]